MAERQAYVFIQLPETLHTVPAALLKVTRQRDGTYIGRFRYGDRYLERPDAVEFDPFQLPLGKDVHEFTKLKGIPGAIRDAAPDAWGRRVIEHKLQRDPADLDEIDYLLHGPQDGAGYLSFGLNREPPAPRRSYNRTHQLSDLIAAAEAVEEGRRVPEQILEQLEAGTSMGGARPKDLALTVGTHGRAGSLYNLVSQCGRFGLGESEARKEIQRIASVIRTWRNSFAACGVASNDIDYVAPAMLSPSFLSETPPGPVG